MTSKSHRTWKVVTSSRPLRSKSKQTLISTICYTCISKIRSFLNSQRRASVGHEGASDMATHKTKRKEPIAMDQFPQMRIRWRLRTSIISSAAASAVDRQQSSYPIFYAASPLLNEKLAKVTTSLIKTQLHSYIVYLSFCIPRERDRWRSSILYQNRYQSSVYHYISREKIYFTKTIFLLINFFLYHFYFIFLKPHGLYLFFIKSKINLS